MLPCLLLGGTLALGEPPAPPVTPPLTAETPPTALPGQPEPPPQPACTPAERQGFMQLLQGTWFGTALDEHRIGISGWTEGSFTASTDRVQQLPMGFNY